MSPPRRRYKYRFWTELTARAHKRGEQMATDVQDLHGRNHEFWNAWQDVQKKIADEDAKLYEERWSV